jgi:hypothetical protein
VASRAFDCHKSALKGFKQKTVFALSSPTANPIHNFMVIGGNKKNGNITI